MLSPLSVYKEVAKEFKIGDEKNAPPVVRLNFVREQADAMQHMVNRLIFDISASRIHMDLAKDEASKAAYRNKASQYENDLRQTSASLDITLALIKELSAELGQEA